MDVLVLDNGYRAINRVSWQTAFGWLFQGKVEVVETYADWVVHSAHEAWPVPSIIRFIKKVRGFFNRGIRFNRKNVYLRDKGKCQYCGKVTPTHEFTYDHVVPRSMGGKTAWENIVVACIQCNHRKADRTPEQAKMRLIGTPVKPKSLPDGQGLALSWTVGMPESWKDWLGSVSYWTDKLEA